MSPFPLLRRLLRLGIAAGLLLPAQTWAATPTYLALDQEGQLVYLGADGSLIQRTRVRAPASVTSTYLDLEVHDFLPDRPGPEVLILRQQWWFDVVGLPAGRQAQVERLGYYRFAPRQDHDPVSLALASHGAPPEISLQVVSRPTGGTDLAWVDSFGPSAPAEGRSHDRTDSVRLPEATGWTATVSGLLARDRLIATLGPAGVQVATWAGGPPPTNPQAVEAPELGNSRHPVRLRLVRDRLFLLEQGNRLHHWQKQGDTWVSTGDPLRLAVPKPLVGIVPLKR